MTYLRHALRALFRPPLVTAVAIVSLGLGIGANAAIFTLTERLILRPLPVAEPERLVNLSAPGPKSGSQSSNNAGYVEDIFSYPMFRDLEQAATRFAGLAAHRSFGANLASEGSTLAGEGMLISGRYFDVLGVLPAHGRLIGPEDDRVEGAHPVVVLSHRYWTERFAGRESVLGEPLVVNGTPMTIVGVAAAGFEGTTLGQSPEVFVPISMRAQMLPGWDGFENRRDYWVYLFARLAEGVSMDEATAAVNAVYRSIVQEVELPLQPAMSETRLEQFRNKEVVLEPGARGQSVLHGEVRTPVFLLGGVTAFVLLIACANVANLLLTKATDRASEIAIRMSIGARRVQVVAQLLLESVLLSLLGGAFGLLVAHGTLRLLLSLLPAEGNAAFAFEIGPATLFFLVFLTLVTGLVGLFPALHCTRQDLIRAMRTQAGRGSRSKAAGRFRTAMTTIQIALSMALLISAGLFLRSLLNVSRVDLGIEVDRIASFGVAPALSNYDERQSLALYQRIEEELRALPGVRSASASEVPLITGSNWGSNVEVEGFESGPDVDASSSFNRIGPQYFETLGIPVLAGREFEVRDHSEAPRVAIVNRAFADKFGLGRDAVGRRMQIGSGDELDIEIVGLAENASYSEVKAPAPPVFYIPYRQVERVRAMNFYVRTDGDPNVLLPSIRDVVAALDPNLPVEKLGTMALAVRDHLFLDRMITTLSAAFATLATLLAAIGLYGVLAYSVAQRSHEIGLRMALGADRRKIRSLIGRQVGWLTVPGALLGVLGALALGRFARSLLFELEAHDPTVLTISVLILGATAVVTGWLPARRAAQIDPMIALRQE